MQREQAECSRRHAFYAVGVTEAGLRILERAAPIAHGVEAELLSCLHASEREAFKSLLRRLVEPVAADAA